MTRGWWCTDTQSRIPSDMRWLAVDVVVFVDRYSAYTHGNCYFLQAIPRSLECPTLGHGP